VHAKSDAETMAVRPALASPNVTLLVNAEVAQLVTNAAGTSVASVVVARNGEREEYSADVVVVAAGAANSALLLLRSANDRHPNGLANGSDQVGRNYMFHNSKAVVALSKEANDTTFQKTLGLNDFYFGADDYQWPVGNIQMVGKSNAEAMKGEEPKLTKLAPHWSLEETARHAVDFWLTTEDLPLPDNRVTVDDDGEISLRYTPTNLVAHARLRAKFESLLSAMQCRDDVYENLSYVGGRLGLAGVAHQNGTIRFGPDPATAPLNLDCKLRELDNVYVADSSFFVSSTAVNPTLTIIANSLRVAEVVAGRLNTTTLGERPSELRLPQQASGPAVAAVSP